MIRVLLLVFIVALWPAAAHAQSEQIAWRQKIGKLRVGIIGGNEPLKASRRVQPFQKALQQALDIPVEIFAASDYRSLIEAHTESRIEYAVYSATAFSAAWVTCKCVTPIVIPTGVNGADGFKSVLIARRRLAGSLRALRNRTVLVPGNDSFAGAILPRDRLVRDGIDPDAANWRLRNVETAEAAIAEFENGETAALFGWKPTGTEDNGGTLAVLGGKRDDYTILWESPRIPYGPHALRSNLPEDARLEIANFLTELHEKDSLAYDAIEGRRKGGFQPVTLDDFQPVIDAVRKTVLFSPTPDFAPVTE